ncbi:NAD(P)/FAD-dependent oxidoreductase [Pendulispora albinea]|uniref:NADH:ubiquinone reductase (non-electrogenic) n=1 Tax=Pendulispora albinea TaxID=2741071 RepID=A0ABZ2LQA9_9BACT
MSLPHIVIVGGGFGGLTAAQSLARAPVRVTLVDRRNHHLFQPLLYQVAMAGLSPADIASPIRSILAHQKNVTVLLDQITDVDLAAKALTTESGSRIDYDFLIVATGAKTDYFGHSDWEKFAPGLKTLTDATEIRRRVLLAFELAERESDEARRRWLLTFVVIGAGPTGVELAGAVRELSQYVLARDFRHIDPTEARVILVEGGPRVLPSFPEDLAPPAKRQLEELGVEIRTGTRVTGIDEQGVQFEGTRLEAANVLWAAGVRAARLAGKLGVPIDRAGRVIVQSDCSLPGHPEVFAIGDMAAFTDENGNLLPGLSPVAMQQARFVAKLITSIVRSPKAPTGEAAEVAREAFRYFDKGTMATIGRSRAVAASGRLRMSGFMAWLAWLFVHLWFLIGHRNRVAVFLTWTWSYLTYERGARLITGRIDAIHAGPTPAVHSVPSGSLAASAKLPAKPEERRHDERSPIRAHGNVPGG